MFRHFLEIPFPVFADFGQDFHRGSSLVPFRIKYAVVRLDLADYAPVDYLIIYAALLAACGGRTKFHFLWMPFTLFLSFGLIVFFSHDLDLPVEYGQRGIHTDNIYQFFVCSDGHGQFRVQFVEHDCGHMVFVSNRSQPPVFFSVLMPLYPTDGKQGKEYERTAYTCPYIRILMPAIGNFTPQQPYCAYCLVRADCLPQSRYEALSVLCFSRSQLIILYITCQQPQYLVKLFLNSGNSMLVHVLLVGFSV